MNGVEYLKQSAVRGLVAFLVDDRGFSIEDAMGVVSQSRTMAKVLDDETGLYRESPAYIYEFLKEELDGSPDFRQS